MKVSEIMFVKKQLGKFADNYDEKNQLGEGSFGRVSRCTSKISGIDRAVKFIKKKSIDDPNEVQRFQGEVNILEQMDHQNIVKLYEVYEDREYFYLVMDLLKGGELFDEIVRRQRYSEQEAAAIMFQLLSSVCYLHKRGFVHRDIKPENVCIDKVNKEMPFASERNLPRQAPQGDSTQTKLIDFGTARKFTPGKKLKQQKGTPFYMAPEIFNDKKYDEKVDIWSLGIVFFILLTGKAPYQGNDDKKIEEQVRKAAVNKSFLFDVKVSKPALRLLDRLLCKDPKLRASAEEALQDPWLQTCMAKEFSRLQDETRIKIMNELRYFNASIKL